MKRSLKNTYNFFLFFKRIYLDYLLFNYYSIFILYIISCPSFCDGLYWVTLAVRTAVRRPNSWCFWRPFGRLPVS